MAIYQVQFCLEMGGVVNIEAKNSDEAEQILEDQLGLDDTETISTWPGFDIVHREYWTQDPQVVEVAK